MSRNQETITHDLLRFIVVVSLLLSVPLINKKKNPMSYGDVGRVRETQEVSVKVQCTWNSL